MNLIKKEDFGYRQIRDIKVSDAQKWIMKLHSDGKGYSTITSVRGVVKPAFQMAYNEDIIRRNPFDFKLVDVVPNDSQKRIAMTDEQQKIWMDFIREDKTYCKYYDEFVVLLGTGMRVSEFCGLTKSDLDFENRRIRVDHQLVRERGGKYYVEKTKTECGIRFIPMTDDVYQSLKNILANRRKMKTEIIVDGYSGFILIDKDYHPKVALHIENEMRWAMKKYKKLHPEQPLSHITPHVFRHTFCTNMANKGMDIKTLQYLMGHSDVGVTLNVYTHASYDRAVEQMAKIVDLSEQRGKFTACSGIWRVPDSEGFIPHASRLTSRNSGESQVDRTPFTTPITTPFVRKFTQIYGELRRFWENTKIKESAKKPGITGFYRLIKGYKIMIKILFVCHGNICRSTMCESIFTYMVKERGLEDQFVIDSCATSTEEIGNPPHRGTVKKLREVKIPLVPHRARQITWSDYLTFDYIIGMDTWNIRNLNRMLKGDPDGKVYKLLSFAGAERDIADPWYTGNFDVTYADIVEGCEAFLSYLERQGEI